ncbi:MAG: hypothetical protein R3A43_01230 [Bacteroidia bacterium]
MTYVLEYYGGGRFTTFFMLKCWKSLRTITSVETIEVIQNMNYNRHQGMYSLSHFFLHFTGVGVYEMNVINSGLVNEPKFEVNHFVAPNRLLNSEWSRHICNGYGLTEEEIFELNCWNLEYQ